MGILHLNLLAGTPILYNAEESEIICPPMIFQNQTPRNENEIDMENPIFLPIDELIAKRLPKTHDEGELEL
jgi:hypothetical protein